MPPNKTREMQLREEELSRRINILPVMASVTTREELVEKFSQMAHITNVPGDLARADYMRWYLDITTPECQAVVRSYHEEIVDLLKKELSELNGVCDRKQKSLLASDTKVLRRQIHNMRYPDNTRQERPSDVHAMRIILDGNCIRDTYRVAKCIMDHFTKQGHVIKESPGTIRTTTFKRSNFEDIEMPTFDDINILKKYVGRYKDYNHNPKGNGYQAIHFVVMVKFEDSAGNETSFPLEIIIYTETAFLRVNREMDDIKSAREVPEDSDYETHYGYKNAQEGFIYSWMGQIPYIQLDGFEGLNRYDVENNEYIDEIGLVKALCYRLSTGDQRLSYDWVVNIGH